MANITLSVARRGIGAMTRGFASLWFWRWRGPGMAVFVLMGMWLLGGSRLWEVLVWGIRDLVPFRGGSRVC
jgi:hypothetical protein